MYIKTYLDDSSLIEDSNDDFYLEWISLQCDNIIKKGRYFGFSFREFSLLGEVDCYNGCGQEQYKQD